MGRDLPRERNNVMNAKSKLTVKYSEGVIEMNSTFAKMMQNPLSEEYALLQRTRQDFPAFVIRRRQIKSNPQKDSYKGLTYEWMRNHIATHEAEEMVEEKLNAFDEMIYISKCHSGSLRYPTIKKWFLMAYPDVARYGIEQLDQFHTYNTILDIKSEVSTEKIAV